MNDDVRIYLVDEYCAGASHFCFSERKDVVLLEDYEKLRAENEKLKGELQQSATKCNKLRCLALHAMSQYYGYKSLFSSRKKTHRIKYGQFSNKFYEAYRKAKAELKEKK